MTNELRFHLEMEIENNVQRGMSNEDARREAMRSFGPVEAVKEQHRENRSFAQLEALVRDARYAARSLRHSPGFTAVAVLTLTLAIGINVAVFTVANATLFKGPPFIPRSDRLLYLTMQSSTVSWPDFEDWRARSRSFQSMAAINGVWISLGESGRIAERIAGIQASANLFEVLGQKPLVGRDFEVSDERMGAAPVAILGYRLWERRYSRDQRIVGKTVLLNGTPTRVIGVMPRGVSFPWMQDLWVPLVLLPEIRKRENRHVWFVIGRLMDGAGLAEARAEMDGIGRQLAIEYPATNRGFEPKVTTFRDFIAGSSAESIYASMWGAVLFVLLIACANLANLQLARAAARSREIALRIALGAGRWVVIRQLLVESLMLAGAGGAGGWFLSRICVTVYSSLAVPEWKRSWFDFTPDYRTAGYVIAISLGAGLLFGLLPAFHLRRIDLSGALKKNSRARLPALLVAAEMALAFVLLAAAGVMMRSFANIYTADTGVINRNVLSAYVEIPVAKYPDDQTRGPFAERLMKALELVPGMDAIAVAGAVPAGPSRKLSAEIPGAPQVGNIATVAVSPAYFRVLGATMLAGREFNDADRDTTAIVNRKLASAYWPGRNPLGKRLRLNDAQGPRWLNVVGVVPDIVQDDRTLQITEPLIYIPWNRRPAAGMYVLASTRARPELLVSAMFQAIRTVEPDLAGFGGPDTLETFFRASWQSHAVNGSLFLIFAAAALLLAAVGLYGVIAHSVSQRTREIGIRMALGAASHNTLRLILGQAAVPLGIGLAAGFAASFGLNGLLRTQLVRVSAADPMALACAGAVLVLAGVAGCLVPVVRALRVDPMTALRHD